MAKVIQVVALSVWIIMMVVMLYYTITRLWRSFK